MASSDDEAAQAAARLINGQTLLSLLFVIAFLTTWVPCFLQPSFSLEYAVVKGAGDVFGLFLPFGCLASAIAFAVIRPLYDTTSRLWQRIVVVALATYVLAFVLLTINICVATSAALSAIAGLLAGASVVAISIFWCSRLQGISLSNMLIAGALAGIGVFFVSLLTRAIPPVASGFVFLTLSLFSAGYALWLVTSAPPHATAANSPSADVRAFPTKRLFSLRDMFSVLASSAIGFVPFILLSDLQDAVVIGSMTFNAVSGLLIGSLLMLVIAWFARRHHSMMPTLFWMVFPVCASLLLFLNSFPKESTVSSLSAGLVYAFLSLLALFAIVSLACIIEQREFPATLAVATVFILATVATAIGHLIGIQGIDSETSGAILRVITTAYLIFLVLVPIFELRFRYKEAPLTPTDAAVEGNEHASDDADAVDVACEHLANEKGLSKREREVFVFLARGYTSPYIAKVLFISDSTVRSHVKSIYRKLGITSRSELIESIYQNGLK